jgi:hypothetical protein
LGNSYGKSAREEPLLYLDKRMMHGNIVSTTPFGGTKYQLPPQQLPILRANRNHRNALMALPICP